MTQVAEGIGCDPIFGVFESRMPPQGGSNESNNMRELREADNPQGLSRDLRSMLESRSEVMGRYYPGQQAHH
jgi:hypothetical protein